VARKGKGYGKRKRKRKTEGEGEGDRHTWPECRRVSLASCIIGLSIAVGPFK